MKLQSISWLLFWTTCAIGMTGCGDGREKFGVAKVSGTVMCQGKPVPFVTVYFQPVPAEGKQNVGKGAIGHADDEGNFVLTTYDAGDGAVVGKHNVSVGAPLVKTPSEFKCDCGLNEEVSVMEAEVVSGKDNVFEVKMKLPSEMPARPGAAKAVQSGDAEIDD